MEQKGGTWNKKNTRETRAGSCRRIYLETKIHKRAPRAHALIGTLLRTRVSPDKNVWCVCKTVYAQLNQIKLYNMRAERAQKPRRANGDGYGAHETISIDALHIYLGP